MSVLIGAQNVALKKPCRSQSMTVKTVRMYGLFEKIDGKWVRLFPSLKYPKAQAVRVFQNMLLGMSMNGRIPELRVVKNE